MSNWSDGYVTEINYTYGYFAELNPLNAKQLFLRAGRKLPEINTACELGFGQGVSVNMHAAASACDWYGTDFNPTQAVFAQELSKASGGRLKVFDDSFLQFCSRSDLPEFDYICLHGIWSWISDENRKIIVDFVSRKLKLGGVLYISYNTFPSWGAMVPLRELLNLYAEQGNATSGIVDRVGRSLDFASKLISASPKYANAFPDVVQRIQKIKTQDKSYLAHEYFNRDWEPMSFDSLSKWLKPAKLEWVTSASCLDAMDALNLSSEQQSLLKEIPDVTLRQTVRDFCINRQFRKDYWVKGSNNITTFEQSEEIRKLSFVLTAWKEDIPKRIQCEIGEVELQENIYAPILNQLINYRPWSIGELEQKLASQGLTLNQICEALLVLTGAKIVQPSHAPMDSSKSDEQCQKLNAYLLSKAKSRNDINYLASPIIGGGYGIGRFQQLFLLARSNGATEVEQLAEYAWSIISSQKQKIVKDGNVLETDELNMKELIERASDFTNKQLPILRALKIAQ